MIRVISAYNSSFKILIPADEQIIKRFIKHYLNQLSLISNDFKIECTDAEAALFWKTYAQSLEREIL